MGDNCEHGNDVRYGCKHCDDAGTEPPLARGRMTDLPDAEQAAWSEWNRWGDSVTQTPMIREAHRAGFAAASGPWAEQLDALEAVKNVLDEYCTAGCCQHAESNEKQLHDGLLDALGIVRSEHG